MVYPGSWSWQKIRKQQNHNRPPCVFPLFRGSGLGGEHVLFASNNAGLQGHLSFVAVAKVILGGLSQALKVWVRGSGIPGWILQFYNFEILHRRHCQGIVCKLSHSSHYCFVPACLAFVPLCTLYSLLWVNYELLQSPDSPQVQNHINSTHVYIVNPPIPAHIIYMAAFSLSHTSARPNCMFSSVLQCMTIFSETMCSSWQLFSLGAAVLSDDPRRELQPFNLNFANSISVIMMDIRNFVSFNIINVNLCRCRHHHHLFSFPIFARRKKDAKSISWHWQRSKLGIGSSS